MPNNKGRFFKVGGGGAATSVAAAAFPLRGPDGAVGAPTYSFASDIDTGFYLNSDGIWAMTSGGIRTMFSTSSYVDIEQVLRIDLGTNNNGGQLYGWSAAAANGTNDTALARAAAGVVKVTDGSTGLGFFQMQGQKRRATDNTIVTNSTTLTSDSELTVSVAAGRTYRFEAELYCTTVATSGIKVAMAGTATHTNIIYDIFITSTSTPAFGTAGRLTAVGTGVGLTTTGTACHVSITGTTTVNAAGTFLIQAAQNAETGAAESVILLRGSTFEVTDFV